MTPSGDTQAAAGVGARSRGAVIAARLMLLVAIGAYAVLVWRQVDIAGTWSEELSLFPAAPYRVVEPADGDRPMRMVSVCGVGAADANDATNAAVEATSPWLVRSWARPKLTLCAGGLALPLMVESYISGVLYWPAAVVWSSHGGDAFAMRRWISWVGAIGLLLAYCLVARLRDEPTAGVCVLLVATSSPFTYPHGLLMSYEVLPWMWLTAAALVAGVPPRFDQRWRAAVTGACVGLAVFVNIKALLVLAPLAALVVARRRAWIASLRGRSGVAFGLAALATSAPLWIAAATDDTGGFGTQVVNRLRILVSRIDLTGLPVEALQLVKFGTDVGAFVDGQVVYPWALGPVAAAVGWSWVQLVRWLRGASADRLGVLCGASTLNYVFVSRFLYDQTPGANFGPLHTIFGITLGAAVCAAARAVAPTPAARQAVAGVVAVALSVVSVAVLDARHAMSGTFQIPVNAHLQRQLRDYLLRSNDGATMITSSYVLAGVPESLSRASWHVVRAHVPLERCLGRRADAVDPDPCLRRTAAEVLDLAGDVETVWLVATRPSVVDPPGVERLAELLPQIAASRGSSTTVEAVFSTSDGTAFAAAIRVSKRAEEGRAPD